MSEPPAPAAGDRRPVDARHLLALLGVTTGVNVTLGLVGGTLIPTVHGLLLAPVVITTALWFVVACALHLRAGRRLQGGAPLVLLVLLTCTIATGSLGRRLIFPGNTLLLPATGPVDPVATVIE